jgi:hypothetical protein
MLHAVEARRLGVGRRLLESRDDPRQLVIAQFPRHDIRLPSLWRIDFISGYGDRARRHRLRTIVEQRMTRPPPVPDLQENTSARAMHRIRHRLPSRHLRLVVNARLGIKRRIPLHGHRRLGNDQSCRGPLRIVFRHQLTRHMPLLRAAPGEGSHEHAVGHLHRAHAQRLEKRKQRIHPSDLTTAASIGNLQFEPSAGETALRQNSS